MLPAIALTAALFAVYAAGAARTIYVGDSGELVTASWVLGVPHPTGYPLYVLLGKAWATLLPVGSVAFRMSLFSAAAAAAACGMLLALARRSGLHPVAALVAALGLAFAPSFWGEANVQRVYALNAAFVIAATSAAWRWHAGRDPRALVLAVFCCALGATNHTFMALYGVVLAGWAVANEPALLRRPRVVAACLAAAIVGLLPYAYLPLRSAAQPPLDWGDPETLSRFLDVVLRRHFWTRAWWEGPADLRPIVADWAASLPRELGWAGASLAALGVVAGWRRRLPVGLPLLVALANVAALAAHGSRSDIFVWHRYYVPSYAMAALLAGIGCHEVVTRLPRPARWLPLLLPVAMLAAGWARFDRSRYRVAEDFAERVLAAMPPGAHLIASDDNVLFVLMYLQLVEGRRPDVDLVMQGVDGPLRPLRFDPDVDALYFTHHPNWNEPGLDVVAEGVVLRARRAGATLPPPVLDARPLAGEDDPRVPKDDLTQNLIGHFHYMQGLTAERTDWPTAAAAFRRAAAAAPDNDVLFYNLGLVYRRHGRRDEAIAAFRRSAAINPRHLASQARPRAVDRLAEMEDAP